MTLPQKLEPIRRDDALAKLVVPMTGGTAETTVACVEGLDVPPTLRTLAWIYLDELERAHDLCQAMDDPTGAALHAIVHRREGDFGNALYWWRRAGNHPALVGQDPPGLVRAVEAGEPTAPLVERQRREWEALAAWCATESA